MRGARDWLKLQKWWTAPPDLLFPLNCSPTEDEKNLSINTDQITPTTLWLNFMFSAENLTDNAKGIF